jgi:UDP-glucuronate 4-epimerase
MEQLFITERPRHVVHMAARAGVRPSIDDPFIYIHSNILGTTRLLELARIHGNDCFVWASSSSVYGGSPNEEFSEDDYVDNPVSPYAASKKACELMTYTYHSLYGMNVSGLRFFTVYGPRGRPDMAPFKFVDRVSRGLEIQQFGDGTSSRDYTYIDDIVSGVVRALDRPLGYQIFNLGNGSPYRLCDFIALVEENVGKKALIKVLPDQPGDVPRTCANIAKAQELLGYEPTVSFEEGIRRTVAWYNEWMATKAKAQAAEGMGKGKGKGKGTAHGVVSAAGTGTGTGGSSTCSASSGSEEPVALEPEQGQAQGPKVRAPGGRVRRVASAVSVFSTGGLSG